MDFTGRTLNGRYRIESRLGEGGMGTVYLARDLELGEREVVIKFPLPDLLRDPQFRERFLAEIRSLASLDNPHIIKIHDAGQEDGIPYAVVQYAGGGDLRELLEARGRLEPEEVSSWFYAAASALDFVHSQGFCHRDVKPANLFFDRAGHTYLSDFGIATVMAQDPLATQAADTRLTMVGTFVGSPLYAPPEAVSRRLSPAYDQYSLAVTVYQALTGEFPVEAEANVLAAKNMQPAHDVRELLPDLPGPSADALMRALERDPSARFESCGAFFAAYHDGLGSRAQTRSRARSRLAGLALAALVAVALGIALVRPLRDWLARDAGTAATAGSAAATPPEDVVIDRLHRAEVGSSEQEFAAAVELCRRHDPECDASSFVSEQLQTVVLEPYALDREEVSVADFDAFARTYDYRTTAETRGFSYHRFVKVDGFSWRNPFGEGRSDDHVPVVHVSWQDASAYCEATGGRLPTEAEWEYAARGDARRVFAWGDSWDPSAAHWGREDVDALAPTDGYDSGMTPEGRRHLSGNAAEWTATAAGEERVIRGGSWREANPAMLRAAVRSFESPGYTSSEVGFRCARDVPGG